MSEQQRILITGASSGIGAATARALARNDRRLILVARNRERLQDLASELVENGCEAMPISMDCRRGEALRDLMVLVGKEYGGLDVLINNAGVMHVGPHAELAHEAMRQMWELNVEAPMLLTKYAIPYLAERSAPWIINVSSIAATSTFPNCGVYSATKAAIDAWSRILREELREQGIRVGVIAPGATDTSVWGEECPFDRSRMCAAHDVAEAIRFMLEQPPSSSVDYLSLTPPGGAL